jgi:hypothetical protein
MKARISPLLSITAVLLLGSATAHAETQADCSMHLVVELTPDVPNPQDSGFLSSLLSANPAYQLNWVKKVDMSFIELDLTGPGPLDRCEDVVETMRRDGRVLSIYPEAEETNTVSVAADRNEPPKERPRVSVSPYGFGAMYWAALHPTQAWRIVLPVEPVATDDAKDE